VVTIRHPSVRELLIRAEVRCDLDDVLSQCADGVRIANLLDCRATFLLLVRCDGQQLNEVVGRIVVDRTRNAQSARGEKSYRLCHRESSLILLFEELCRLRWRAQEGRSTLGNQQNLVKHSEQLRARLMDRDDDCLAFVCQSL
jgi:hypothetical protein